MKTILGISAIAFLAIFAVCNLDYRRTPAEEFDQFMDKPTLDFPTLAFTLLKLFVLFYAFYVISRQVIGTPSDESIWTLNWTLLLGVVIGLLSSAPLVWYQALRVKSKSKTISKIMLYFALAAALFFSGLGQILVAGVSSSKSLQGLKMAPVFLLAFSLMTGLILTVSAVVHFNLLSNAEGRDQSHVNRMFVIDSFNAAWTSVLSILVAASFWVVSN